MSKQVYVHEHFSPATSEYAAEGIREYSYKQTPCKGFSKKYDECTTYNLEDFKAKYPKTVENDLKDWDGEPFAVS